MMSRYGWLAALLFALVGPALAQPASPAAIPTVSVESAWARATPPHAESGAIYMTLRSPSGDTLTGASATVAASAAVHETALTNGVMRMRPLTDGLQLPPGKPVMLKPGGYHIMLEGLKAPLVKGEQVAVHLTFRNSPPIDIMAPIEAIGAAARTGEMPGMTMPK